MRESQAARFADLLERVAAKARALSVDRLARAVTIVSLGCGAAVLVLLALVMALVGIFRLLAVGVGATGAYAILGGLFLAAGGLIWRVRARLPEDSDD